MSSVSRVDQALLLLKGRLRQLQQRSAGSAASAQKAGPAATVHPMAALRQLAAQGGISERELRKALVRTLLDDAFGEALSGSLEFRSMTDQVSALLEADDGCRQLLGEAIKELR